MIPKDMVLFKSLNNIEKFYQIGAINSMRAYSTSFGAYLCKKKT